MSPPQEPLPSPSAGTPPPASRPWDALPLPAGPPPDDRPFLRRVRSRLMRLAPRPIVRLLARPYVAGETRGEAVALARRLHAQRGLWSTLDVLGEDLRD